MSSLGLRSSLIAFAIAISSVPSATLSQDSYPVRQIIYEYQNELREAVGEVLVEGEQGGFLILAGDGQLIPIQSREVKRVQELQGTLSVLDGAALEATLREELPEGFRFLSTEHYVICYNTSDAYAKWLSGLFERLYRSYYSFWETKQFKLQKPRFKLVAVVFATRQDYLAYAEKEVGRAAESIIGYYNQNTNRVTTFDLTGVSEFATQKTRVSTPELIASVLAQPAAERNVATIIHESFHQLAHNSGLQTRLAHNPLWVSEGLATFFESPDPSSSRGLGKIGIVNTFCLRNFRSYFPTRPKDALQKMIKDDSRFRDPASATAAYAESWAFNYFLLKTRHKEYVAYLKHLSQLPPLGTQDADVRLEDFQQFFGDDWDALDRAFIKFIGNLKL